MFTPERLGVNRFRLSSFFSSSFVFVCVLLARKRVARFIRVSLGSLSAPSGRRIHSGSRGFTRSRLGFSGFIGVRVGSLGRA